MTNSKKQKKLPVNKKIQEDMRKLVIERIKATSGDLGISIGSTFYTKDQVLKHVEVGDEIGQEIIDMQMEYLRDLAKGTIYQDEHEQGPANYETKS